MTLGQKIKDLRTQRGMTQEQLADAIYVTRAAISKWETGKGYPGIDSLKLLAGVFGVTIPDGSNTNPPLNAAFGCLVVLPHCNASGHCCFVIAPIHPKIRYLRVRSNLKRADRFRYKAKPAGNSDPYCQGV